MAGAAGANACAVANLDLQLRGQRMAPVQVGKVGPKDSCVSFRVAHATPTSKEHGSGRGASVYRYVLCCATVSLLGGNLHTEAETETQIGVQQIQEAL